MAENGNRFYTTKMTDEKYKLPESFSHDMGGENDTLDGRMTNVLELLEEAPLDSLNNFLDIGAGKGQILKWLSNKGKKCTGIGLEIDSYGANLKELKNKYDIEVVESGVEKMPFPDQSFDGIVMSHVLEHCPNIGLALREVKRVLKDDGWLFIFVPPHDDRVTGGHIAMGWNIGQLMYVLVASGFDIKAGKFIAYGYNICGFVQKNKRSLPAIRYDQGDIHILQKAGFFPAPIETADGQKDGFFGNIKSINWNPNSKIIQKIKGVPKNDSAILYAIKILLFQISKYIPERLKDVLALLLSNRKNDINNRINPEVLKG